MARTWLVSPCLGSVNALELDACSCSWIDALVSSVGQDPSVFSSPDMNKGSIASIGAPSHDTWQLSYFWFSLSYQRAYWCAASVGDVATYREHMDAILEGLPRNFWLNDCSNW